MLIKTSDFSDSFLFILLMILSPESVFWDKIFLLKDALFAPVEFWLPIKFTRSSCNLLLVIGLSSFPWLANDKVPDSSETTIQIHLSNLSVIPNAAKCLVPYLLIPCLERGSITPAEIILLPLTRTAPSCKGVSVAKRFIKRSAN